MWFIVGERGEERKPMKVVIFFSKKKKDTGVCGDRGDEVIFWSWMNRGMRGMDAIWGGWMGCQILTRGGMTFISAFPPPNSGTFRTLNSVSNRHHFNTSLHTSCT